METGNERKAMNSSDTGSFWDRTWKDIDPERIKAYADNSNTGPDAVIAFLKGRGVRLVCDAGCGCGVYALKLAKHGFCVSGFDIAEDAVELAKKLLSDNGYPTEGFRRASVLDTGWADASFDAVVAKDVVDHMPISQGTEAVKELMRLVRPGGHLILCLDATDGEYESEPHETNADGDYLYTSGKWEGMAFHPYSPEEINKLTNDFGCDMLPGDGNGFTVLISKPVTAQGE